MDLEDLKPYIVIPLTGEKVSDHEPTALRIMDGEVEPGVKALWDDEEDTLVAFLFAGSFTEEKARQWVKEAEEKGTNLDLTAPGPVGFPGGEPDRLGGLMALLRPFLPAGIFDAAMALVGKEPVALVWEETENEIRHRVRSPGDFRPDTFRSKTLKGIKGVRQIEGKLKASKVPEGHDPDSMVVQAYRFSKKQWTMAKAKAWMAKHKETATQSLPSSLEDEEPVTLHIFPVSLEAQGPEELPGGLIWKEILSTSTTYRPQTGDEVIVTQDMVDSVQEAFEAGVLENVAISADSHFHEAGGVVPAEKTVGFVQAIRKVGGRLWAGLKLLDEEVRGKLETGLIKDASVFIHPEFHDRRDGKKWPWVLVHLLLTNYPQLVGLAPFGEQPAASASLDFGGAERIIYTKVEEVNDMGDKITLTAEEAQRWEAFKALDLTPEDAAEFQGLGLSLDEIKQAMEERGATRDKARDLEVQAILLALEGKGEHGGVVQVPDTRHFPVVCVAVEKALKEQPQALALDIGDGGQTSLDEVVLAIVNAIPEEGRMSLTAQPTGDREPVEPQPATEEQIDELNERLQ